MSEFYFGESGIKTHHHQNGPSMSYSQERTPGKGTLYTGFKLFCWSSNFLIKEFLRKGEMISSMFVSFLFILLWLV